MSVSNVPAVLTGALLFCATVSLALLTLQHSIAVEARLRTVEEAYMATRARLEALEQESASHLSGLQAAEEVLYRMTLAHAAAPGDDMVQPRRRLSDASLTSEAQADSAIIRVDAPNGTASIVMGGMRAPDNLILHKDHPRDGALVSLSRNATRVLSISQAGTLSVDGSLSVGGHLVAGGDFRHEVRLFLGGLCPEGWTEAIETAGKLLGSRGGSDVAGSTQSTAGISATTTVHYEDYYYLQSNTNPYYDYVGCNTERESHRCDRTATPQVTITGPDSVAILACKRA